MTELRQPPRTPPLPPVRLPQFEETALSNGMGVILLTNPRFPLVTLRLGFDGGSRLDPADRPGLSEAMASLMTEGTEKRDAQQIAENLAELGAALNVSQSEDAVVISGNTLKENLRPFIELAAEVTRQPSFPEDEVALYRENRLQELIAQRAQPTTLANEQMARLIYGGHPYSRIYPTPESIESLTTEALLDFRNRLLSPDRAWIVLLGDLPDRDQVLALLEDTFGKLEYRDIMPESIEPFPQPKRKVIVVNRPGSVQANLVVGRLAIDSRHPEYFPLMVGNTVLGGGASSRLFMNIREKKGYAYSVGSYLDPQKTGGSFGFYTQVRPEMLEAALTDCIAEVERMANEEVPSEELQNVKNYLSGTFVLRLETQGSMAGQLLAIRLRQLPRDYLETYTANVRAVTPEDIQRAARQYMNPEPAAIVAVGDAASVVPAVGKFGEVELVEAGR